MTTTIIEALKLTIHTRRIPLPTVPHLSSSPLKSCHNSILDLIEVHDSLGAVNEEVWTYSLRTKAPDLTSFSDIILILLNKVVSTISTVLTSSNLTLYGLNNNFIKIPKGNFDVSSYPTIHKHNTHTMYKYLHVLWIKKIYLATS